MSNQQKACTEHPKLPKSRSLLPDVSVTARTRFSGGAGTSEMLRQLLTKKPGLPTLCLLRALLPRLPETMGATKRSPSFPKPVWESNPILSEPKWLLCSAPAISPSRAGLPAGRSHHTAPLLQQAQSRSHECKARCSAPAWHC